MTHINIYAFIYCLYTNGNKLQVTHWNTVGLWYEDVSVILALVIKSRKKSPMDFHSHTVGSQGKRVLTLQLHNTESIDHVMSTLDIDGLPMHRPPFIAFPPHLWSGNGHRSSGVRNAHGCKPVGCCPTLVLQRMLPTMWRWALCHKDATVEYTRCTIDTCTFTVIWNVCHHADGLRIWCK